jgi:hypothetical protein
MARMFCQARGSHLWLDPLFLHLPFVDHPSSQLVDRSILCVAVLAVPILKENSGTIRGIHERQLVLGGRDAVAAK